MNGEAHPISLLMMMTFGIVLLVAIGGLLYFLRKPSNRHSMDNQPERGEPGAPDKPRGEPLTAEEAGKA